MPPEFSVVIGSRELGLQPGAWTELDAAINQIGRERVVLRLVAMLNVFSLQPVFDAELQFGAPTLWVAPGDRLVNNLTIGYPVLR
jgi:hypothetical protein